MNNSGFNASLIAGAILAGAGGVTVGLAAIARVDLFATIIGLLLLATGVVVMCSGALAATFRAYARLYRSQWQDADDGTRELSGP